MPIFLTAPIVFPAVTKIKWLTYLRNIATHWQWCVLRSAYCDSHTATVEFDQAVQKGDFTPAALTGTACDLGSGGALAFKVITATTFDLVAIPCGVIASVATVLSNVQSIIHHAATSNGCMRFQSPRGIGAVRFAVYADHSVLCHSMD
jgi:hypothetical protein